MIKRTATLLIAILITGLITFFVLWRICSGWLPKPEAKKGFVDTTQWDFEKNGPVTLNGEWEFYPKRFLSPGENASPDGYIKVPKSWNQFLAGGNPMGSYGYGTYRLTIRCGDISQKYGLIVDDILTACRVWASGEGPFGAGVPGIDRESTKPAQSPFAVFFPGRSESIEIIIHVSNFSDSIGGIVQPIKFGYAGTIENGIQTSNDSIILIFGLLVMAAIVNLFFFIFRRNDSQALFLSMLCLVIASRCLFINEAIILRYFPFAGYELLKKIEFLTLPVGTILFFSYLGALFKEAVQKVLQRIIYSASSFYIILIIVTQVIVYSFFLLAFQFLMVAGVFYVIFILINIIRKQLEDWLLFCFGICIFMLTVLNEIIFTQLQIGFAFSIPAGMVLFILVQSLILSIRFSRAFSKIEFYSGQLSEYSRNLEEKVASKTQELKQAAQEKTDIFVTIAHETKTPLTLVRGYIEKYIREHGADDDLTIIRNNLEKLIANMIGFLDIEKYDRKKSSYDNSRIFDLSRFVSEKTSLFKEAASSKEVNIASSIEDHVFIRMDPLAMDRVLNNLLENALRYTDRGGSITVTLESSKNEAELRVKDTGIGIKPDKQLRIFEPYYQATESPYGPGIGMGLAIVKRIIEAANGRITVASEEGKGTCFSVFLEKHIKLENEVASLDAYIKDLDFNQKRSDSESDPSRRNLLFVDDNPDLLQFLSVMMKPDFNVYTAKNGRDAMEKLMLIPRPHVIVSDIVMDLMGGYELFDRLIGINEYADVPFIFLSARSSHAEKIKGLSKGAVDFITKPFYVEELKTKIDSLIRVQERAKKSSIRRIKKKVLFQVRKQLHENEEYYIDMNCKSLNISGREKEIISLIIRGKLNKEIGYELNIAENTVNNHIKNIYKKCDVQNRVELVNLMRSKPESQSLARR